MRPWPEPCTNAPLAEISLLQPRKAPTCSLWKSTHRWRSRLCAACRHNAGLKCLYIITEEDAVAGRAFEDTIGWRSGYLDL